MRSIPGRDNKRKLIFKQKYESEWLESGTECSRCDLGVFLSLYHDFGLGQAEIESAEMLSYRHICGRVADPNADICADPNRPGTGDRATYIFK